MNNTKEKILAPKIIEYSLHQMLKETSLYISFFYNELEHLQKHQENLVSNKPIFFQKQWKKNIKDNEKKISEVNTKLQQETEHFTVLYNQLKNKSI